MRVLGVETSCDETAVAVYDGAVGLLANGIYSQVELHSAYGGVVPELASRDHLRKLLPLLRKVVETSGGARAIDGIACTTGPGLVGALMVGSSVARSLAYAWDVPCLGVHHMEGHLLAPLLEPDPPEFPFVALLVSGGHSMLLDVPAWGIYRLLGETRDDAVGEAFDKVGSLLGLGYPGGPAIEREARAGDPTRHRFPRPMLHGGQRLGDKDYFDLSMSGLKTALIHAVRATADLDGERAHLARGFQDAVIDVLVAKTLRAVGATGHPRVVLSGGVACNQALRAALAAALAERGATLHAPSPRIATDNAAMIARAGLFRAAEAGRPVEAAARLPFPGLERR